MASIACRSARLWERSAAACSSAACSSCQLGERTYSSEPATAPGVRLSPTAPWPAPSDLERTTTARRPLEGVRGADFVAQGTAILDAGLLASTGVAGGLISRDRGGKKRRLEERWFRNLSERVWGNARFRAREMAPEREVRAPDDITGDGLGRGARLCAGAEARRRGANH